MAVRCFNSLLPELRCGFMWNKIKKMLQWNKCFVLQNRLSRQIQRTYVTVVTWIQHSMRHRWKWYIEISRCYSFVDENRTENDAVFTILLAFSSEVVDIVDILIKFAHAPKISPFCGKSKVMTLDLGWTTVNDIMGGVWQTNYNDCPLSVSVAFKVV